MHALHRSQAIEAPLGFVGTISVVCIGRNLLSNWPDRCWLTPGQPGLKVCNCTVERKIDRTLFPTSVSILGPRTRGIHSCNSLNLLVDQVLCPCEEKGHLSMALRAARFLTICIVANIAYPSAKACPLNPAEVMISYVTSPHGPSPFQISKMLTVTFALATKQ